MVLAPRSHFNELAKDGRLQHWRDAYENGYVRVAGQDEILKLIGNVIERHESAQKIKKRRLLDAQWQRSTSIDEAGDDVRPGLARGDRRAALRALSRGLRGGRHLQALAREDGDRGGRPPVLPDHDEPPPAAHQRRVRVAVPAGQERGGRARWSTRSRSACRSATSPARRSPTSPPRSSATRTRCSTATRCTRESEVLEVRASAVQAGPRRREGAHRRLQPAQRAGRDLPARRAGPDRRSARRCPSRRWRRRRCGRIQASRSD